MALKSISFDGLQVLYTYILRLSRELAISSRVHHNSSDLSTNGGVLWISTVNTGRMLPYVHENNTVSTGYSLHWIVILEADDETSCAAT